MRLVARAALLMLLAMASPAAANDVARVYAAASLTEAMTAIARAYAASGRPAPILVFGASSALSRQIEHGAPAGVFISADEQWAAYLVAAKLVAPRSRAVVAGNRLVVVVPQARARQVRITRGFDITTLLRPGRRWATGDPAAVPAGRYAQAALTAVGTWARAAPRLARAENVRAALAFVERGDADAGIVYATDARASGKVAIAGTFPTAAHPPIVYPAVLLQGAGAEARAFHGFLGSRQARAILAARGFTLP